MSKTDDREINRIIYLMQTDESFDAPPDAIQWSKNLFRARAVEPKKSVVERVRAVLQTDLSPNRAAFGERSVSASQARQMLFQAGDNGIDLRIKREEKAVNVQGQILGADAAGATVQIGEFSARADENGKFKFTGIPIEKCNLIVTIGEKEIVVGDLKLQ